MRCYFQPALLIEYKGSIKMKRYLVFTFVFLAIFSFGRPAQAFNPLLILNLPFVEDIAKVAIKSAIKYSGVDEYLPDSMSDMILDRAPPSSCTGVNCIGKALPVVGGIIGAVTTHQKLHKEFKKLNTFLKAGQYSSAVMSLAQSAHLEMRLREIKQEMIHMREEGREHYAKLVERSKKTEERLRNAISLIQEEQQKNLRGQIRAAYSCVRAVSQKSLNNEILLCKNKISDLRHKLVEYEEGLPYVFELASFEFDLNLIYQPKNIKSYQQLLKEVASVPTVQELKTLREQIACIAPRNINDVKNVPSVLIDSKCTPRESWFAQGMYDTLNREELFVPRQPHKDLYLVREGLIQKIKSYLGSDLKDYSKKDMLEFARILIKYQYDSRQKRLEESKLNTLVYSLSLELPELKDKEGHWQIITDVPFLMSKPLRRDERKSKPVQGGKINKIDTWSKLNRDVVFESISSEPPTEVTFKWMEDPYVGGWTYEEKFTCTIKFDQEINQYVVYDPLDKITSRCGVSNYMISYRIYTQFKQP